MNVIMASTEGGVEIEKVAAVSDSRIVSIMPRIVDHFINAKVKYFPYENLDEAVMWVRTEE